MNKLLLGTAVLFLVMVNYLGAEPVTAEEQPQPEYFSSFELLNAWALDCYGGGSAVKFTTAWKGKSIELCYTKRRFTSGVPSPEIIFWQPDGKGGWFKTVGTTSMYTELRVNTSFGGATIAAYDESTKSWVQWMTISTPMLCDGMPRSSLESIKANQAGDDNSE